MERDHTCEPLEAMENSAVDFIDKPFGVPQIFASIDRTLTQIGGSAALLDRHATALGIIARLTPRQHQIMEMVTAGYPNKIIAADLKLSQRTVEVHRAAIMKKTGSKSLPDLIRLSIVASGALA